MIAFACKKENGTDCVKSNGPMAVEIRNVGVYEIVKVYDKIDLNIVQGSEFKLEVNAGGNLLSNIQTTVKDGILTIKNNNRCNFVRGYKKRITVTLTVPKIKKVDNEGVGTLRISENFTQDTIFVRAENSGDVYINGTFKLLQTSSHGNGDIYLTGQCDRLYAYMYGTNFLNAQDLIINSLVFVETISIGDARIRAPLNGNLDCNIWRSGNIYYTGEPTFITNFSDGSGSGRLIKQ